MNDNTKGFLGSITVMLGMMGLVSLFVMAVGKHDEKQQKTR